ncbi:MAG TPA: gene transfer agent family protein [Sphingomonas sp.]
MSDSPNPAPPNPARGEAALTVGGRRLVVRPSFAALVAAEQEIGPLFDLVDRAASGRLGLADTITLIFHCIADRPDGLTRERLGEALVEAGVAVLTPVLRALIGAILRGR